MNMDTGLVNRALFAAGREMLTDDDKKKNSGLYTMCREAYLRTFLEALSEAPWTGGKRRKRLIKTSLPRPDAGFRFAYELPHDCARPVELLNREMFAVEGGFLYTDVDRAELLYVANGRVLPEAKSFQSPKPGEEPGFVFTAGMLDELDVEADVFITAGRPRDLEYNGPVDFWDEDGNHIVKEECMPEGWDPDDPDRLVPFPEEPPPPADDYPDYRPPQYEPKFYGFVEKTLAAKFALAENPRAHTALLQEAMLIKQEALNTTRSIAAAKQRPSPWWTDRLGLGGDAR